MMEMIFVLSIISICLLISLRFNIDLSKHKMNMIYELCYQAQFDSYVNKRINEIEIYDSSIFINDKEYDLSPLNCDNEIFHYNKNGNISHAFTLICRFKDEYEYRFQLGSGWISYEE